MAHLARRGKRVSIAQQGRVQRATLAIGTTAPECADQAPGRPVSRVVRDQGRPLDERVMLNSHSPGEGGPGQATQPRHGPWSSGFTVHLRLLRGAAGRLEILAWWTPWEKQNPGC